MQQSKLKLGFIAAPVDAPRSSDEELYETMVADVAHHRDLGFEVAWMIEHHFSDYYPTPDPLMYLSHLVGQDRELEVGTAVIVTPWHDPLRLAEQIAMLSHMTDQPLHLGLGRGTAKYEYDAFRLDMAEARDRFREVLEVLKLALSGEPFTYSGEHLQVDTEVRLRPMPRNEQINFYGAIGSPTSASLMARYGMPPICTSIGDFQKQRETLESWHETAAEQGLDTTAFQFPIMVNCIVADTDEEAVELAQTYITRFMNAQVNHYAVDDTDWSSIKGYEQWGAAFKRLKELTDPSKIPGWTEYQLVGSPQTVRDRTQFLLDIGFDHIILHCATPEVPFDVRKDWSRRFVEEVVPQLNGGAAESVPASAGTETLFP